MYLAAGRAVRKCHRPSRPELRRGFGGGDLPDQRLDLGIAQWLAGEMANRTILHQGRRLADRKAERFRPLFVHYLYQLVESGHLQSQSRGRMRRTRDLLK